MKLYGKDILAKVNKLVRHPVEGVLLKKKTYLKDSIEPMITYTRIEARNLNEAFEIDTEELLVIVSLGSAANVLSEGVKEDSEGTKTYSKRRFVDLRLEGREWHLLNGGIEPDVLRRISRIYLNRCKRYR